MTRQVIGFKRRTKSKAGRKTTTIRLFGQKGTEVIIDSENIINLKFGNAQHTGDRAYQEDSFGYSDISCCEQISLKGVLAVLADGMGGLANGKQVSEYVVSSMKTMFEKLDYTFDFSVQLQDMVVKINDNVSREFFTDGRSGAGSTVVVALVYKTKLYWVCIGDSRLYLMREGSLYQMNEDHNYRNQLFTEVIHDNMSREIAESDPQKDSLTSYIGNEKLPFIDCSKRGFSIQKGDILILCSDGIYNGITNVEMIEYLDFDPQVAADKIVKRVLSKKVNGQDNLTIMVINYN